MTQKSTNPEIEWHGWDHEELWNVLGGEPSETEWNKAVEDRVKEVSEKAEIYNHDGGLILLENKITRCVNYKDGDEEAKEASRVFLIHWRNFLLKLADEDAKIGQTGNAAVWRALAINCNDCELVRLGMPLLGYMWT